MEERRAKLRADVAIPGRAAFGTDSDVRCVALNFSPAGACLLFPDGETAPRYFQLTLGAEPAASDVRVVWRRPDAVGVAFVSPKAGVPDVRPG